MQENINDILPYAWKIATEDDSYSDVFNRLIREEKSTMSLDECREYALMVGGKDIEEQIEILLKKRKLLKNELLGLKFDVKYLNNKTIDEYVKDAYPLESLFIYRY